MSKKSASILPILIFFLIGCFSACQTHGEDKKAEKKKGNNTYARDELSIQHGLSLFNQHCASCHSFMENGIGPNLTGITSEVDKEWLIKFIKNPPAVIESGDERAKQSFEKYKQYMPPFPMIQGDDIEHLLGFIHKFSEGEKRNQNNRPGGLINPIEKKITTSDLTLVLEEWLTIPASAPESPKARINKLSSIEGGRLFICDLRGKLYEITGQKVQVYLDIALKFPDFIDNPGHATGLGSFAFHPDFKQNGLFYTTHTEPSRNKKADFAIEKGIKTTLQWVLSEWKADQPSATQFSGTSREVLRADMITGAHGFQELVFNPLSKRGEADYGLLYLGIGDGGSALGKHSYLCGNLEKIWGNVIRIVPSGNNSKNGKYGIPKDNPFAQDPKALGEIWASGFRNPHRISWDESGSGKMFISNIGQHSVEELNLGKAGANYGWPFREGTFLFDTKANPELVYPLPEEDGDYTYPTLQYDHDEGNAISGGFVYSGTTIPGLKGKYIFGDIPRGTVFYAEVAEMKEGQQAPIYKLQLEFEGVLTNLETITQEKRVNLRFGKDAEGEIYLYTKSNGVIYKIINSKKQASPL